mmetsp:Transcript_59457/g.134598  ORF Transcript_59457/g.134598 Transcript_59457/m.134598 type:complete len:619 (+) Transcript_59457:141-1997(+)
MTNEATILKRWEDEALGHGEFAALGPLLGRRVELFVKDREKWVSGYISRQGKHPSTARGFDGVEGVGWQIMIDFDVEGRNRRSTQWTSRVRGVTNVRFVGHETVFAPGDNPGGKHPEGVMSHLQAEHQRQLEKAAAEQAAVRALSQADPWGSPARLGGGGELDDSGFPDEMAEFAELEGPRHLGETHSSVLPAYAGEETERIKQAFAAGNYHSLRKLPDALRASSVLDSSSAQINSNLSSGEQGPVPSHASLKQHGLFHAFEYLPSQFSLAADLAKAERLASRHKMAAISGGNSYGLEVAPLVGGHKSASSRSKYEAAFPAKEGDSSFGNPAKDAVYPYMSDPYEAAKDSRLRAKLAHEAKALHGPLVPTGAGVGGQRPIGGGGLSQVPTQKLLPEIVKGLHALLVADWGSSNFNVSASKQGCVCIKFEVRTVDSPRALVGYMNHLATDHPGALNSSRWCAKYQMKRVVQGWGTHCPPPGGAGPSSAGAPGGSSGDDSMGSAVSTVPTGWVAFVLRPPWVKAAPHQAYGALHPESTAFRTSSIAASAPPFAATASQAPSLATRLTNRGLAPEASHPLLLATKPNRQSGLATMSSFGLKGFTPQESESYTSDFGFDFPS